jgi:hypothetical protein
LNGTGWSKNPWGTSISICCKDLGFCS